LGALARTFFKQNHRAMTLHKMRQERRARLEAERLERAAAAARADMQEKAANAWKTESVQPPVEQVPMAEDPQQQPLQQEEGQQVEQDEEQVVEEEQPIDVDNTDE
jgi:hypothetical protein